MDKLSPPVAFCHCLLSLYFNLNALSAVSDPFKPSLFLIRGLIFNYLLSVTQSVISFTKLQGLKRQNLCSHTLHNMEYIYYINSGLSLSYPDTKLCCTASTCTACVCYQKSSLLNMLAKTRGRKTKMLTMLSLCYSLFIFIFLWKAGTIRPCLSMSQYFICLAFFFFFFWTERPARL